MPAPYNITLVSRSKGIGEFVTNLNAISGTSGGLIGLGFWVSVLLISFLGLMLRGHGIRNSFAASAHFTLIVSLILWAATWISDTILIISIALVLGSYVLLAFNR